MRHLRKNIAFYGLISALLLGGAKGAYAIAITGGPTLLGSPVTSEINGLTDGVTVQFTLDSLGSVQINFFQVSPVDSSLTQVASINQSNIPGSTLTRVFWNALWLIGTDFARHNGTFLYQVVPSTNGTAGTALPVSGDSSALFTIDSLDIHNLAVTPSRDAAGLPTSPYTITYALAKSARVTATVYDSSDTVIRTIISGQAQAGESVSSATVTWDGLETDGTPAPIGNYTVRVTAADLNTPTNTATPRTAAFSVLSLAGAASNPQKLFEDNVYVFPNPIRNGVGTFHMEAIRDGAILSLKIYTISGDLVRSETFPGIAAGNSFEYLWTATNQSGNKVGRGLYYYVLREEDSAGTLQTVKKLAVLP